MKSIIFPGWWRSLLLMGFVAMCIGPAAPLNASPLQIFGFWPRDVAMAGAVVASDPGLGAAYHNPASSGFSSGQQVGVGFAAFSPQLFIDRSLPFCGGGPEFCAAQVGGAYSDVGSELPEPATGVTMGWVKPLGGAFKNRLALSASLYLPTWQILRVEGLDSTTPHFLLYQNLTKKLSVALSAAVRPFDWLSAGVGAHILSDVGASVKLHLDTANNVFTQHDILVEVEPKVGALAGVMIRPLPGLSIGVSYREELPLYFRLPADIQVGALLDLDLYVDGTVLFSPHQFDFGLRYFWLPANLEFSAQANLALWSRMRDPTPRIDIDTGGRVMEGLGLGNAFDLRELEPRPKIGLQDTWTVHSGVDWGVLPSLSLRGGFQYRPSPVPRQEGSTNLLDNQVYGFSAGVAWYVGDVRNSGRPPVELAVGGLALWLPRRTLSKAPGDRVGPISHGGMVVGGALSIAHKY